MPTPPLENSLLPAPDQVLSVSGLNRMARQLIERSLPLTWVAGEVSNLARPASGHVYFVLKDAQAQVRCVMFRNRAQLLPFRLSDGQHVEVRALAGLYEARGEFQLTVETARQAGAGSLYEAFLRLRARLEAEGLLAAERKRPLPALPRCIGVITSLQAAALHDVRAALRRRAPGIPVVVFPTAVQGDGAGTLVAAAVERAGRSGLCDVLLVCRGGGSIEDLWAFNDEAVARAIVASPVPVVVGVGHESDVTLADLVADVRAATPTAAAELVSAGYVRLIASLGIISATLRQTLRRHLHDRAQRLDLLARALVHPAERLARSRLHLDGLRRSLAHAATARLAAQRLHLLRQQARLEARRPELRRQRLAVDLLGRRLQEAMARQREDRRHRVQRLADSLVHLNPLAVLERGYSVVRDAAGTVVRDAAGLHPGDALAITLARGTADARVTHVHPTDTNPAD